MRVTRLEIFGFKSFVDRFVLNFDTNLIGVVGPNGCGKSNIVDALRWVLGETHAKHLRGNILEDLIFNGSESRRPLGMAEVSITFRPDPDWVPATLTPLHELDSNGNGSHGDSEKFLSAQEILEQEGAFTEELTPELKGEVGENLLPASLLEIPGLFQSAEIQLTRRLYRSGESEYFINRVPCRLRDMVELYRLMGLGARGLSIVQQGEIGEIISKKPLERRELLEEAAGIAGFRTRMEAAQRKLERTSENMSRLGDIILEVEKQVRNLRTQANRARQRNELKENLQKAELTLFQHKVARALRNREHQQEKLVQVSYELDSSKNALVVVAAEKERLLAEMEKLDVSLGDSRRLRDEISDKLNSHRAKEQEIRVQLANVDGKLRTVLSQLRKVDERKESDGIEVEKTRLELQSAREMLAELEGKKSEAENELTVFQNSSTSNGGIAAEISSENEEIAALNPIVEALPGISAELVELEAELKKIRARLYQHRDELNERKVNLGRAESELGSLNRQLEALAEHVVKNVAEPGVSNPRGAERLLLSGVVVPTDLQRAVSAVLGEKGNFVVANDIQGLAANFQLRKASGKGDGKFGVVSEKPFNVEKSPLTPSELSAAPGAVLLLDQLNIKEEFYLSFSALLGTVALVDSLSHGLALIAVGATPNRIAVTRAGEVIFPWGWQTTQGEGIAFSFTNRIEELQERKVGLEGEIQNLAEQISIIEEEVRVRESAVRVKEVSREEAIHAQKRLSKLHQEAKDSERARHALFVAEERSFQERLRQVTKELAGVQSKAEYSERRIEALKKELIDLDLERRNLLEEKRAIEEERQRTEALLSQMESDEIANADDTSTGFRTGVRELEREFDEMRAQIQVVERARDSVRMELSTVSQSYDETRRIVDKLSAEQNELNFSLQRSELESSMILDEFKRYHGEELTLPTTEVLEPILALAGEKLEEQIAEAEEESNKLRRRLEREGEVDPEAIALFESEELRLNEMRTQLEDLERARATLERTIKQLKEISRLRFLHTFNFVSEKFSELIPRLFGGGAGHMELVNPEDPLTSGVELTVRPPGKKLRSMELLSGGEKALAATAVLVAMFLHRPGPICVLDEVDAPLDDVNLDRFLALIREISAKTQFVVITHNKQSMAAVDRLIGITMQESGVSTALSVSLDEAEAQILAANA